MALLPRIALAAGLALSVLAPAQAQVVQVRNTGCPNASYPTHNNTARLGRPFTWNYNCTAPAGSFAVFGFPTGGGVDFNRPLTCSAGPCRLYVALSGIVFFPGGVNGTWTIPIPNDRRFLFSTWSVQAGCFDFRGPGCFDLSGALTLAIGP